MMWRGSGHLSAQNVRNRALNLTTSFKDEIGTNGLRHDIETANDDEENLKSLDTE